METWTKKDVRALMRKARRITTRSNRLRAAVTALAYASPAPVSPSAPVPSGPVAPGRPRGSSRRYTYDESAIGVGMGKMNTGNSAGAAGVTHSTILGLCLFVTCNSQSTNLPDSITSYGNKFQNIHFEFNTSKALYVDSIVLEIDSIKALNWNGSRNLQIIIGNNHPDFYHGFFKEQVNGFVVDSLRYVEGFKFGRIASDSNGNFRFQSMKLGYNFQSATPYFMPGIWGKIYFYFNNGLSFNSIVYEDRSQFSTGLFESGRKSGGHRINLRYIAYKGHLTSLTGRRVNQKDIRK